ncbi:MAG: VPLPA-CTERM sorting domain-containing protein [Pseudomonadota bacterium]
MRNILLLVSFVLTSAFGTSVSAITITESLDATGGEFDEAIMDVFDLSLGTNTISGSLNCLRDQPASSPSRCSSGLGTDTLNADFSDPFAVIANDLQVTSISFEVTGFESTLPNDPGFFYSTDIFSSLSPDPNVFEIISGNLPGVGSTGNVLPPIQIPAQFDGFLFDVGALSDAASTTPTQTSINWTVTIETAAVPLPAGFPLLAAGLGALMFLRRK